MTEKKEYSLGNGNVICVIYQDGSVSIDKELLEKLIEKHIPQKPKVVTYGNYSHSACPVCNCRVMTPYCMECGQKIDWSGIE